MKLLSAIFGLFLWLPAGRVTLAAAVWALFFLSQTVPSIAQSSPIKFSESPLVVVSGETRHTFTVELAETEPQRARGLMFRTKLAFDRGMLFDFKGERYASMWMRNTLIPLDMLFTDRQGRVTHIHENAVPGSLETIQPPGKSAAVLELAGGSVARLGLKLGDRLDHPMFK